MTEQQVEAVIKGKIQRGLSQGLLQKVGKEGAALIRRMIIERILQNKDLYGNNFGGYNKSYKKDKAWAYAAAKYGTYKYSSSRESDKLRLTGRLLNRIRVNFNPQDVRKTSNQITYKFNITTERDVKDQVEGLQSTTGVARNGARYSKKAWYFLGISKQLGEQDKLKNFLIRRLGDGLKANIKTKNK